MRLADFRITLGMGVQVDSKVCYLFDIRVCPDKKDLTVPRNTIELRHQQHNGANDMKTKITKFNPMQIEALIDKLVPLLAAPEDYEFFRGVLTIKAEESGSAEFTAFAAKLLKSTA